MPRFRGSTGSFAEVMEAFMEVTSTKAFIEASMEAIETVEASIEEMEDIKASRK